MENKTYLSLDDVSIMPAKISHIEHRSECSPYWYNDMLPIFTAPMSSVINLGNYKKFQENKINTILPRTLSFDERLSNSLHTFIAVGLDEFENRILDLDIDDGEQIKVCIDIANGHMSKLLDLCRKAKEKFGDKILLMVGNIANSETYFEYYKAGIDYVRVGIGGGNACLTSVQSAIHTPMATLLSEIHSVKIRIMSGQFAGELPIKELPKIIADGGIDSYDKIIKCLALGADYVMCGKIFAQCEEACGEKLQKFLYSDGTYKYLNYYDSIKAKVYIDRADYTSNIFTSKQSAKTSINTTPEPYPISAFNEIYRNYYGMSTKKAQKEMGKENFHTSEGVERMVKVEYSLSGWIENFIDYFRSAMSYCDSYSLYEFQKKAKVITITGAARAAYIK